MTTREGVDALLDERARVIAKGVAVEAHLWAAEFLLKRVGKLLPTLITADPVESILRDALVDEIREFLDEERPHGLPDAGVGGEAPPASGTTS